MKAFKSPLVIALICLIIIDVFFGRFLLQKVQVPGAFKSHGLRVANDIYHHGLKPNFRGYDEWGFHPYEYCTNNHGFRASCKDIKVFQKVYDYALLGDSMVEGLGVEYEKTIAGLLDTNLKLHVANLAVSSYSASIYLAKYRYLVENGFSFRNVIVFVDISDIQDEAIAYDTVDGRVVSKRKEPKLKTIERSVRHTVEKQIPLIWHGINSLKKILRSGGGRTQVQNSIEADRDSDRAGWTYLINERNKDYEELVDLGLTLNQRALIELSELVRKQNAKIFFVIYPWPHQILFDTESPNRQEVWAKSLAKQSDSMLINLYPIFEREKKQKGSRALVEQYFIAGDTHFNELGHQKIFSLLAENLRPAH